MKPEKDKQIFNMENLGKEYIERALRQITADQEFKLLITVPKLAELLDVNVTRAYEITRMENFPSLKIGRKILIPIINLLAWLEQQANLPFSEQYTANLGKNRSGKSKRLKN